MSNAFIAILNMSLTASYVALIVIAIRYILGKCRVPKIFSYVLWAVVLVRLTIPVSFESVFSLIPGKTNVIPQHIVYSENSAVNSGITSTDTTLNSLNPHASVESMASIDRIQVLLEVCAVIWLAGVAAILTYSLVSYVRLKRRLTFATHRDGNIYETDQIQTPFVFGFVNPRIYLSLGLAAQETGYIIKHEQSHIRRYDHLIKPIAFFVLVVHWFNPLMWLCYVLMIKDMEMSCDEKVIKEMNGDIRASYSRTLLALASKQSKLLGPLSFGESNVKSRIKNVLHYHQPTFWVVLLSAIVVAAVSISLLLNPMTADESKAEEQQIAALVEQFGDQLKMVSLSDPRAIVIESMKSHYSEYVSQRVINMWMEDLDQAPGRLSSSPWPERIELLSIKKLADDAYEVKGRIVEMTGDGNIAATRPITLEVKRLNGRWVIDNSKLGEYEGESELLYANMQLTEWNENRVSPSISLAGYISMDGDTLHVDEVEVITNEYADQLTGLKLHDPDRIAELDLHAGDMPNGYYIHNPSTETLAFNLTEETVYTFTDVELSFVEDAAGDRRYTTTEKEDTPFTGEMSYPVIIEIDEHDVLSVTEIFLFTQ